MGKKAALESVVKTRKGRCAKDTTEVMKRQNLRYCHKQMQKGHFKKNSMALTGYREKCDGFKIKSTSLQVMLCYFLALE